jgi:predicted nucleic acid-binding protein
LSAWFDATASTHHQLNPGLAAGNPIPDAALAALAIEHGVTLASTDTDFARFRGLRWENPLN